MSLIKFRDAGVTGGVRALDGISAKGKAAAVDPRYAALHQEVERLNALVAEKDAKIASGLEAMDAAFSRGRTEGRTAALEEMATDREALVESLEAAVDRSLALLERELTSMERLAVVLASESLEKILGAPGAFADMANQIIREQLGRLDSAAIVRIEVSAKDFVEADRVNALSAQIGTATAEIRLCDDLPSGDCRIKMTLGTLDIGLSQQWSQLKSLLQDLSQPGAAE